MINLPKDLYIYKKKEKKVFFYEFYLHFIYINTDTANWYCQCQFHQMVVKTEGQKLNLFID